MTDFTQKPWLEVGDRSDPEVQRIIEMHTREARKVIRQLAHRYRKQDPEAAMNSMINTVGILAAEIVRDLRAIAPEVGEASADVVKHHIENALNGTAR